MADTSVQERIVRRVPVGDHDGASGAGLERARLDDGSTVVLKRFDPTQDLTMLIAGRVVPLDVELWRSGTLDRLPAPMSHAVLHAWDEDGQWVLAMADLGSSLLTYESMISQDACKKVFAAADTMHRAFADELVPGLWSFEDRLSVFAPRVMAPLVSTGNPLPAWCLDGWEKFGALAPPDVVDLVDAVHARPASLAEPLVGLGGRTLLHGDLWLPNIALEPGRVTVIDWGLATWGPPVAEFVSFLVGCANQVLATREVVLDDLRTLWGNRAHEAMLQLGLVLGVVEMGWNLAWHTAKDTPGAREAFDWWIAAARRGADTGLLG